MKASKVQIENEDDSFFSLSIWFSKDSFLKYIVVCRDVLDDPDTIVYTECLDKLYYLQATTDDFCYQIIDNVLHLRLSSATPLCFFTDNSKLQKIELSINDLAKVQAILADIFPPKIEYRRVH
ncbi:hypothetical protein [Entomomonas asaccharolytica]|uniref:Uncharacterized protein n=1 Tax=Entomomonas asaccharolytica TaxID=2785331 RepID=A0A974RY10_9GAMM|nr:hypothetical protein [Entomomonas asaccharolytica]QQP86692.1 hypothetical protein JHT90_05490 [Entomomonas asaccharolytica]